MLSQAPTSLLAVTSQFLELFEHGDVFCLLIGGLLLMLVAQHAGNSHDTVQRWGTRIGVLAFVGWYLRDFLVNGLWSAGQLVTTGVRALIVLLYATNAAWLLLAIGFAAFGPGSNQTLIKCFRKRQASESSPSVSQTTRSPTEPVKPEPAVSKEEAALIQAEAETRAEQQRQRDEIRFELELLYDRYRQELRELLPPDRFTDYFTTRLTNELPVDIYQTRARQVTQMIRDRLQLPGEDEPQVAKSVEEIITEFNTRRQQLQYHGLDEDVLETLQLKMNEERNAALHDYFRNQKKRRT